MSDQADRTTKRLAWLAQFPTAEAASRALLHRTGVEYAERFTSGDLVFIAELIRDYQRLAKELADRER